MHKLRSLGAILICALLAACVAPTGQNVPSMPVPAIAGMTPQAAYTKVVATARVTLAALEAAADAYVVRQPLPQADMAKLRSARDAAEVALMNLPVGLPANAVEMTEVAVNAISQLSAALPASFLPPQAEAGVLAVQVLLAVIAAQQAAAAGGV